MLLVSKPQDNTTVSLPRMLLRVALLWRMRRPVTSSIAIASLRGECPQVLFPSSRSLIRSAGKMVSLTGRLYLPLDSSVILGTEAPSALWHHPLTNSLSSILMAGTNCVSDSVAVEQVLHGPNTIANYYECAGTQHLSTALEPHSLLTFLKHTTK